jgi:hypothetical protein
MKNFIDILDERIKDLTEKLLNNLGCPFMTRRNLEQSKEFYKKLTGKDYDEERKNKMRIHRIN